MRQHHNGLASWHLERACCMNGNVDWFTLPSLMLTVSTYQPAARH